MPGPPRAEGRVALRLTQALLILVLLLGAELRLYHLDFGLPEAWHYDEVPASRTIQGLLRGNYHMHTYYHPPLLKELAFLGLSVGKLMGLQAPVASTDSAPLRYALSNPGAVLPRATVILAERLVSFLFGSLAVLALYLLAREFVGPFSALGAAALLAVLPLHVISSKYGTPDAMLSFFFPLNLWVQVRLVDARRSADSPLHPSRKHYFVCGLLLALAFADKYNAAFLFISFLAAHGLTSRPRPPVKQTLLPFAGGALLGLLACFPGLFFEARDIYDSISYEGHHLLVIGHFGVKVTGRSSFYAYHFAHSILPATGPLLLTAALSGLLWLLWRRRKKDLVLLACVVPYYVAMESVYRIPPCPERYVLPLVGVYLLCAVVALTDLCERVRTGLRCGLFLLGMLALLAFPVWKTAHVLASLYPDTREQAAAFLAGNVPREARIFLQPIYENFPDFNYYPDPYRLGYHDLHPVTEDWLKAWQAGKALRSGDYVVATSLAYQPYLDSPEAVSLFSEFYRFLLAPQGRCRLLFQADSPEGHYLFQNPTIRVCQIR